MRRAGMRRDEEGWAGMGRYDMGWYDMAISPRHPVQCDRKGKLKPSQPKFLLSSVVSLGFRAACGLILAFGTLRFDPSY